jgi:hypothetical protein
MSLKITPATAVAGFHNHKDILVGVLNQVLIFAAFEKEYLVTVNTCQSADWQACIALTCKHAEEAAHQVENGLNRMLATEICLPNAHAVAKTNGL